MVFVGFTLELQEGMELEKNEEIALIEMHHLKLMIKNPHLVKTVKTNDRLYIKARLLNKLANICFD